MEARHFGDAVGGARMKRSVLVLRAGLYLAVHLAGAGEAEFASWSNLLHSGQQFMRTEKIDTHGGGFVFKGIAHGALRRQVIALVGLNVGQHFAEAGMALQRTAVQMEVRQYM